MVLSPTALVQFHGQPIFAVVGETREQARAAARLAKIEYEELPATIEIWDLDLKTHKQVTTPLALKRGDAAKAIADAPRRLKGRMWLGGQGIFTWKDRCRWQCPARMRKCIYSSTQGAERDSIWWHMRSACRATRFRSRSGAWAARSVARKRRQTRARPSRPSRRRSGSARSRCAWTATRT